MAEQPSSDFPFFSNHTSHNHQDDPVNPDYSSSPNPQYRKVASRRRKNYASLADDPVSPQSQNPFQTHASPQLPILPPPVSTSYQNPYPGPIDISSPSRLDQSSSPTDPLPFTRHSVPIHLPSPGILAQLRHSVPPAPMFPSMANVSSSLPSSAFETSTKTTSLLSSSFPIPSMYERSPSLGPEINEGLSSYAQPELSTDENSPTKGRNGVLKSLTSDERKQRRLLRNRLAAKECRKKKKAYVMELEDKVQQLEGENSRLKTEIQQLNGKLQSSER